jgi:hypothetical protein
MKQWFVVCALVLSSAGWAQGIDGVGRISVGGGFRWVPNWWFQSHAADLGTPVIPTVDGGGAGFASFGLGVTTSLEVSIDLLFGYHEFALRAVDGGTRPFSSLTAGDGAGGGGTAATGVTAIGDGGVSFSSRTFTYIFSSASACSRSISRRKRSTRRSFSSISSEWSCISDAIAFSA